MEFRGQKEFHPVDEYSGHGLQREENNRGKTQNVSALLLWCQTSLLETLQSNLSWNGDLNAMIKAKISTVAF